MAKTEKGWFPRGVTLRQAYDLLYWLYEEVGPDRKLARPADDGNELPRSRPNFAINRPWRELSRSDSEKK